MLIYHGSPHKNIKKLRKNSYVTIFPHVAYYMGMYYPDSGKTWKDDDLRKPYGFEDKIYFKKNRRPLGVPTIYVIDVDMNDIIIDNNFPFEFRINKSERIHKKVSSVKVKSLLEKSKKMYRLIEQINFNY